MQVYGKLVDDETRCIHYHSEKDIVALKCAKCLKFYPCYQCHNECEDHHFQAWEKTDFEYPAVLCGHCRKLLSIHQYLHSADCPYCHHSFNPNCAKHYDLYFKI